MSGLDHPMVGRDSLISGATIVALVVLCLAGILQHLLEAYVFVDGRFAAWASHFDHYTAAIGAAVAIAWSFGILYGWANGGPGLAGIIALVPLLVGELVDPGFAMSPAFLVGVAGASVAVWLASWVSYAPEEYPERIVWAFGVGLLVTAIAGSVLWVGSSANTIQSLEGESLAVGLWGTGILFGVIWSIAHLARR